MAAPDGGVYVGTGNEGKVFRIDAGRHRARCSSIPPSSKCTRWRRRRTADSSSARRPTAGSTRSTRTGKSTVFFDPRRQVHLVAGGRSRTAMLFAATGEKGLIYKITADGKGEVFYQHEGHARHHAAVRQERQTCWSARSRRARCFRIDTDGKGFVLLDPGIDGESARSASTTKGTVYVAALSGRAPGGRTAPSPTDRDTSDTTASIPVPSVSTEITSITIVDVGPVGRGGLDAGARRAARHARCGLPHPARRASGTSCGSRATTRRTTCTFEAERRADRRHRQQRQTVPARRRSGRADAAGARGRAAGDGVPDATPRPALSTRPANPGQAVPALGRRGDARHLRIGVARRADGVHVGRDQLAGRRRRQSTAVEAVHALAATPRRPTTRGARGPRPYARPRAHPITSPKARYLQWRAVLTGQRRAARC